MLIDEFLPKWDATERYSIKVNASIEEVCRAMRRMDWRRARLTNFLLKLRGISAPAEFSLFETAAGAILLNTETRVFCADAMSRARFRLYWFFIGAFSGLIRREILCVIKQTAESNYDRRKSGSPTYI